MPSHPKITIPYIQKKFDDFNRQYFGNLLPPIPIKLSNAKTFLGKVCFRKERKLFSRKWHWINTYVYMDNITVLKTANHMNDCTPA